ncbi:hypothetical protein [Hymenobacter psychrotolerans]|uniref:Uncharacterized protein n=1 Tax=Hymenobacter psychrotolerans DSM 18569 TaxID=1121959 RepID=A0A1M7B599_9BACT|nr:hypothetical protein [Hymenobacter psychrotolerans]SHL50117.1 hypothetical protein SAMN02746009_02860 [Hymenobacter psychrotolerans DSM 18569]
MLKNLSLYLLLVMLCGCVPEVEKKGIDAVAKYYGGQVNYKIGMGASTNAEELQGRYVELELVNDKLGTQFSKLSIPASNCAYLFYTNLTEAEKQNYSYVKIAIKGKNNLYTQAYTLKQLAIVELAKDKFDEVGSLIAYKRYDELLARVNDADIAPSALDNLKTAFINADEKYGQTKAFQLQGFEFFEHKARGEMQQMLSMFGTLQKERISGGISLSVDPAVSITKRYIVGIHLN